MQRLPPLSSIASINVGLRALVCVLLARFRQLVLRALDVAMMLTLSGRVMVVVLVRVTIGTCIWSILLAMAGTVVRSL